MHNDPHIILRIGVKLVRSNCTVTTVPNQFSVPHNLTTSRDFIFAFHSLSTFAWQWGMGIMLPFKGRSQPDLWTSLQFVGAWETWTSVGHSINWSGVSNPFHVKNNGRAISKVKLAHMTVDNGCDNFRTRTRIPTVTHVHCSTRKGFVLCTQRC